MKKLDSNLDRKKFLMASAGVVATALLSGLDAAENSKDAGKKDEHQHHHQSGSKNAALVAAANDCVGKAEICVNHCIESFRAKDTSLIECMASVREMIPLCQGLSALAAYESAYLKDYAKICIQACESCIKECDKHAQHHQACADCAASCKKCIEECKKVLG